MKILNWSSTGWFAKNFVFKFEQQILGELTFNNSWLYNGEYSDQETKLKFFQNSFWDRNIVVIKDAVRIGEIHIGLFGEQTLKLLTGEKFYLSTSFWEQEVYWKTERGETIVKYQQELMSSLEKGLISAEDSLTLEMEKLLISSGIFVRQMIRQRIARVVVIFIPIIAAGSKL